MIKRDYKAFTNYMVDYTFLISRMSSILKNRGDEQLLTKLLNSQKMLYVAANDFVGSDYTRSIRN